MSSTLLSVYIPRMAAHHDEESVINVMTNYGIGTVCYVDFTTINKQPGFGENVDKYMKSAFVHFCDPKKVGSEKYNYYMSYPHKEKFWDMVLSSNGPYKLQVSMSEYWLCLENKNPVQRTLMNVHQIVENGRYLENLIEEQSQTIKKLENKLEGLHNVVYQLVGGLFNHQTQAGIMAIHHHIMGFNNSASIHNDTSKWDISPTTRQGDENDRRIESLEQTVRDMLNFDYPEAVFTPQEEQDDLLQKRKYEEIDDCSVSTHSSMPELEEASVDSEQRIRNSFELCGNE
jgi:hypothetical protein